MIRVVLDTNVLISATFWKGKPFSVVKKAVSKEIKNYISIDILSEYQKVLQRDFNVDEIHAEQSINTALMFSTLIAPEVHHEVVKDDPDDNIIIDCSVAAKAAFIITQDKHLLKLKKFSNALILTPDEFLQYED